MYKLAAIPSDLPNCKGTFVGLDLETQGLDPHSCKILIVALHFFHTEKEEETFIIDCTRSTLSIFKNWFETCGAKWILHNAKFDVKFLMANNIKIKDLRCTLLCEVILNAGKKEAKTEISLKVCLEKYLGVSISKTQQKLFIGKTTITRDDCEYAAGDVKHLLNLYKRQWVRIRDEKLEQTAVLEFEVCRVLAAIELNGIYIDKEYWLEQIAIPYQKDLEEIEKRLYTLAKRELKKTFTPQLDMFDEDNNMSNYNWRSSKHKVRIMKELGYEVKSFNEKYDEIESVSKDALQGHASKDFFETLFTEKNWTKAKTMVRSMPDLLLAHSFLNGIVSKYGHALLEHINPVTKRIHTDFWQCVDTGRVSSSKPNLQNIPAVPLFRKGFRGQKEGSFLVCADFDGMELRIIAYASREPAMLQAFNEGKDVHSYLASLAFKMEVSKTENSHLRARMKTINFGLAYGAGPSKFKADFDNDEAKAKDFIDNVYFKTFPKLKRYLYDRQDAALANGFSTTLPPINRKRYYENAEFARKTGNRALIGSIKREGVNHQIQGASADCVKRALADLFALLEDREDIKIILQVHDEILIECGPTVNQAWIVGLVKQTMESSAGKIIDPAVITMKASVETSTHWTK